MFVTSFLGFNDGSTLGILVQLMKLEKFSALGFGILKEPECTMHLRIYSKSGDTGFFAFLCNSLQLFAEQGIRRRPLKPKRRWQERIEWNKEENKKTREKKWVVDCFFDGTVCIMEKVFFWVKHCLQRIRVGPKGIWHAFQLGSIKFNICCFQMLSLP